MTTKPDDDRELTQEEEEDLYFGIFDPDDEDEGDVADTVVVVPDPQ